MDLRLLRRPLCNLTSSRSQWLLTSNIVTRRHESSYRRTKKKLNIPPDPSFLLSTKSPKQDHIVYNAPSSPPSVFDTPLLFLPKDDKRRKLFGDPTTSTLAASNPELPPLAMPLAKYERHHLTEEDVAEIKRLRTKDPENWSTARLARKFNCSARFIAMCCETTEEKIAAEKEKLERVKARWGPKRRKAREDRAKRKEIISRDE